MNNIKWVQNQIGQETDYLRKAPMVGIFKSLRSQM